MLRRHLVAGAILAAGLLIVPSAFVAAQNAPKVDIAAGEKSFASMGCAACHKIKGKYDVGNIGPELTKVGGKLKFAQIVAIIKKPPPGSVMPAAPASTPATTINNVAGYLASLK